MLWVGIFAAAIAGGIIQTVTGFGAAVILMIVLPVFFDMVVAPAISSTICAGLNILLVIKFRKEVDPRVFLFPTLFYLCASTAAIYLAASLELEVLSAAFGIFLMLLSVYSFFFSRRLSLKPTRFVAATCALLGGACSGLFSTGGPIMALFFSAATDRKESYTANFQALFVVTNLLNLVTRVSRGIYTADMVPFTILGILGVNLGKHFGLRLLDKLDAAQTKKIIYLFVGLSGLSTTIKAVL